MVCFEEGLPKKSDYRKFRIRGVGALPDDFASMREVVSRRYKRLLEEGKELPDLVLIDGGKGQLGAAMSALEELGIGDQPVASLAKKEEVIFLPGRDLPVVMPRDSPVLQLVQRVRDEAHRFAITYHRQKRSTSMLVSLLDDVPGLGESRRKALMKQFGSLKRLRAASTEELMAVPGIGRRTAEAVQAAIAEPAGPPSADDAVESTTAPQGPAERGTPRSGAGDTAEVGLVAS